MYSLGGSHHPGAERVYPQQHDQPGEGRMSRELDVQIAEFMGLEVRTVKYMHDTGIPSTRNRPRKYPVKELRTGKTALKHYSSDIAAAMLVVEKSVYFNLEREGQPYDWICKIVYEYGTAGQGKANTAAEAICRAALAATEGGRSPKPNGLTAQRCRPMVAIHPGPKPGAPLRRSTATNRRRYSSMVRRCTAGRLSRGKGSR